LKEVSNLVGVCGVFGALAFFDVTGAMLLNNVFETVRRKILNNSEFNVFKQKNIENGFFFVCFLVILGSFF